MNPLPSPCSPWHMAQATGCAVLRNSVLPALIVPAESRERIRLTPRKLSGAFAVLRGCTQAPARSTLGAAATSGTP